MVDARNKGCAYNGCSKRPSYGTEGSTKEKFCCEHKRKGMVNFRNKLCAYNGCSKRPSYGTEGSRITEFCCEHKREGTVNVNSKRCAYNGCSKRPSHGSEASRTEEFCCEHKREGMVNVCSKRCAYNGCSKRPSYGTEGSRITEFCCKHKRESMVNVRNKRCSYHGCSKIPSYGTEGSRKTQFCNEHKRVGMVNVNSKRCSYHGCSKVPSYGTEGSTKREFCSEHKRTGMVDVITKRCSYHGCSKVPSYGTEGSKKREFCSEHKRAGMVHVISKRCSYQGCSKHPSYGAEGSRIKEVCSEHRTLGMVNVRTNRCAYHGCSKVPLYGTEGSRKREFCREHKRAGTVDVSTKRCASEGCVKHAVYGPDGSRRQKLLCSRHFTEGHHAGASAVEAGNGNEVEDEAGGQVSLAKKRKRTLRVERFPRQVQKVSALVRESFPTTSPTEFTPRASEDNSDQSRVSAKINVGRDDRATPRARIQATHPGCGKSGVPDPAPDSGVAAANLAQLLPTQGLVRTYTGQQEETGSTRTTGSGDATSGCGDGGERVEACDREASSISFCADAETDITTSSSQVEPQVTFDEEMASQVAANSKSSGHQLKSVQGGPGTAIEAQTRKSVGTMAPRPVDVVVEEGEVDDYIAFCEIKTEWAGDVAVSPLICLDMSTVAIKPEG